MQEAQVGTEYMGVKCDSDEGQYCKIGESVSSTGPQNGALIISAVTIR